jgi:uncharacterized protein with NAD-binding domain and iron-sulfur cluster
MSRVAIVGGGVAGMTAAHELIDRGFDVVVLETRALAGGKARSLPVPGSGIGGRRDLPAEHGFRSFPGFYRHIPDSMSRIPFGPTNTVLDNLVGAKEIQIARAGGRDLIVPARFPASLHDLESALQIFFHLGANTGIPAREVAGYAEYEHQSWWDFSGAETRSEGYRKFLADGMTRSLVAAQAREMSARTGGYTLLRLLFGRGGSDIDRVLNGPTNDVWLDPWVEYLMARGVDYRFSHDVQAINYAENRVRSVTVAVDSASTEIRADYYIAAVPVEQMRMLVTDGLRHLDPALGSLSRLTTRWMNGILFYLDVDVKLVSGHTLYMDSEWSLTSIAQQQFWTTDLASMGDGRVAGILSVVISDWESPGRVFGKVAFKCTAEQIQEEVWAQLKNHLDDDAALELGNANVQRWFLDPDITFPNPIEAANLEPLLINTAGSWPDRPAASPRERRAEYGAALDNLFLAADYVRTYTDIATMEAANEAGRRAVNGILEASGSNLAPCSVWRPHEPRFFAAARALDSLRFKLRRPPKKAIRVHEDGTLEPRSGIATGIADRLPNLHRHA